jgi:pyrroline-5-carboxylate reductase
VSAGSRIVLVGFGNMGQALARGWLARGFDPRLVTVVDPVPAARASARALGFVSSEHGEAAAGDLVLLAVKPNQLEAAAGQARAALAEGGVVLSIAAGKTLAQLASLLGAGAPIVRAMPNTPAAIGRGATVLCASAHTGAHHRELCTDLMAAVGIVEWVEDEALMDAVTAVSGSGPAYVFLLIECLTEAGRRMGLPVDLAARLATATVSGAGEYAAQSEHDAAELRRRVTSPNGTTQAALERLTAEGGLASLLNEAVAAATERSRELSGE